MSTFYVRKDGSGTHTTIQSAIYVAVNGDIIDIGEGTFNENVELMGKSLTLQGAGKDKTTIQGKATNDLFTGCSYYGGESVVTMPSTSGLIVGKLVSGLVANTRISEIISSTQFQTSIPTVATGNITKPGVTWSSDSSTITLPSATAVVVGMKVEAAGVNAIVTAYNATTRVVTLSSPTTQSGAAASLLFRKANVNVTVTQISSPSNSSGPASIMVTGISDGLVIKDLRAIGFENSSVGQEAAALFFTAGTFPGHTNFLIDNCWITANGDCAVLNGANPHLSNGTFQNCLIDGKTFIGSEPADVPSFSTYISPAVVSSIGATTSVLTFSDMRGIIVGRSLSAPYRNNDSADVKSVGASSSVFTFSDMTGVAVGHLVAAPSAFSGSGSITAISGNDVTINKVSSVAANNSVSCTLTVSASITAISGNDVTINKPSPVSVGVTLPWTFTLTAYAVPNVARNLFYIGDNKYPAVTNTKNITFKNNVVNGQTGAVISASGSKSMFNSAVTIESDGGLVENNTIDGIFGAGESLLLANFAIRCRQPNIVVQNNVNKTSGGRQNSGFYVALGTSTNNITVDRLLVEVSQSASNLFVESMMEKGALAALPLVSSHPLFSNEANWNLVSYVFKHNSSSRRLVSSFKDFNSAKKSKLKANMKAGDRFELHKIILATSPRDLLVLKRSQISGASGFDFDLLNDGPEASDGGGGGVTPQPTVLLSSEIGNLIISGTIGQTMVNDWSGMIPPNYNWGYRVYRSIGFAYNPQQRDAAGMVDGQTYKVRLYFSSLSISSDTAAFKMYHMYDSSKLIKTKSEIMSQFNQYGYVEFEVPLQSHMTALLDMFDSVQNSISANVSKIEILPV